MKKVAQNMAQDEEKDWMKVKTVWSAMVANNTTFLPNLDMGY